MKLCKKCGLFKDLSYFYNRKKSKDGKAYVCKECSLGYQKDNIENQRAISLRHYYKNRHNIVKDNTVTRRKLEDFPRGYSNLDVKAKRRYRAKLYREDPKNKLVIKKRAARYTYKIVNELGDAYVKRLICKRSILGSKDIPGDLVELKREQLKLDRLIRDK